MNNIHGPRGREEEKKNKSEEKPDEHFVELSAVYIHRVKGLQKALFYLF